MADVDLAPIIMHSGDQSNFVAADIKDSEFPDLVSLRKGSHAVARNSEIGFSA